MYYRIAVHHPRSGKEAALIQAMHTFGETIKGKAGFQEAHAFRDRNTGAIVSFSVWDSRDAFLNAAKELFQVLKDLDLDSLLERPIEAYDLEEI